MRPRRTGMSTSYWGCRRGRVFWGEDAKDSHGGRARHGPPEHLLGALVETAAGNGVIAMAQLGRWGMENQGKEKGFKSIRNSAGSSRHKPRARGPTPWGVNMLWRLRREAT